VGRQYLGYGDLSNLIRLDNALKAGRGEVGDMLRADVGRGRTYESRPMRHWVLWNVIMFP
jgi:hypothetical protein